MTRNTTPRKMPGEMRRSNPRLGSPAFWVVLVVVGLVLAVALFRPAEPERPEERRADAPARDDVAAERPIDSERRNEPRPPREAQPQPEGRLRQVGDGVFESTAGLRYGKGGAEGHRIDHILRHAHDAPERPVHGVFIGTRDDILGVIDEAYTIARQRGPPDVRVQREDSRTVYTVKLGRKIGYLGGQSGKRQRHPTLTHLRLVLEGRDVITAFPVRP